MEKTLRPSDEDIIIIIGLVSYLIEVLQAKGIPAGYILRDLAASWSSDDALRRVWTWAQEELAGDIGVARVVNCDIDS